MATSAATYEAPVLRIQIEEVTGLPANLEAELERGRPVELACGEKVVGVIRVPEQAPPKVTAATFDWAGQLKEMWGDRVFDVDTTQWIREDRDARG